MVLSVIYICLVWLLHISQNTPAELDFRVQKGLHVPVQHLHGASKIRLCMGSIDLMDLKRIDPINEQAALRHCPDQWGANLACKLNPTSICLHV